MGTAFPVIQSDLKKRKLSFDLKGPDSLDETTSDLDNLLRMSPYSAMLRPKKFIELDSVAKMILNEGWDLPPQYRFACVKMLAGCILLDTRTGRTIMANTIEVYGRTATLDTHRKRFGTNKDTAWTTSLPNPLWTRYEDVHPTSLATDYGHRLCFGTQTFNGPITSSTQLGKEETPSLGGATELMGLDTPQSSKAVKTFLDAGCMEQAIVLTGKENICETLNRNRIAQLHQLRLKFHPPANISDVPCFGPNH
ncbi:hypothetical protein BGZ47_011462 [Haplosporangium gracile]|nr:hypothetical protein BGZ47_011462 [Haplosporangium gracile]